ncbi:MAG: M28 family peptidase [Bryobacteraceae bacterium]|jgi:Zn-dependent M28 family amino/carboxypeptidase
MLRAKTFLVLTFAVAVAAVANAANFSGASALQFTKRAVDFGPRPSGSAANLKLQAYILNELKLDGCTVSEDAFVAQTPKGAVPMKNIIAKFPGKSGHAIVITGHFDTKNYPGRNFVGANDGGSSTGFLLEMGRVLAKEPRADDVYLVFFDGEEAVREEWEGEDNLYGSRHLAERWRKDGTITRIKALINVDMIGDKNLDMKRDPNSSPALNKLVWSTAAELGYQAYFLNANLPMEDDHQPFLKLRVPAIDLIDFNYGLDNRFWHEDTDTMDKLSAQSLEIVGTVVVEVIHRLERQ